MPITQKQTIDHITENLSNKRRDQSMKGLKRPKMDAIFINFTIILLSTIYYIFVTRIFIYLFIYLLFCLFFNVENKVGLMWSEQTLRCCCETLKTSLYFLILPQNNALNSTYLLQVYYT